MFESMVDRSNGYVIQSLLQNDKYKFTMQQVIFHQFPWAEAEYEFLCRTQGVNLAKYVHEIRREVDHLCSLKLTHEEIHFLKCDPVFKPSYIEFLRGFQLNRDLIEITAKNGELYIKAKGPMLFTSLFEIYILAIVHEVYSRNEHKDINLETGRMKLIDKIGRAKQFEFNNSIPVNIIDFGTRRAFTSEWQEEVLCTGSKAGLITGTSSMLYGMLYGIPTIGTFAHEYVQAFQGLDFCSLENSQKYAFHSWLKEYDGKLGIALSDTLGLDKFLRDFSLYFANAYSGVRHDSGDAFRFADQIINHYMRLGIDPKTKMIVFSDGLDMETIFALIKHCHGKIKYSFGVGTTLMNDVGVKALQMVMKLVMLNGNPVAKLSDNPAKTMCKDQIFLAHLREAIKR